MPFSGIMTKHAYTKAAHFAVLRERLAEPRGAVAMCHTVPQEQRAKTAPKAKRMSIQINGLG